MASLGALYLVAASVLGAVFIVLALRLAIRETPKAAMPLFSYSITYLTAALRLHGGRRPRPQLTDPASPGDEIRDEVNDQGETAPARVGCVCRPTPASPGALR